MISVFNKSKEMFEHMRYCPICDKKQMVSLTVSQTEKVMDFLSGKGNIQDLLPELSADEREFFVSGICMDCWEDIADEED